MGVEKVKGAEGVNEIEAQTCLAAGLAPRVSPLKGRCRGSRGMATERSLRKIFSEMDKKNYPQIAQIFADLDNAFSKCS